MCWWCRSSAPLSDAEILRIFDDVDTDHSGELSWAEFKNALRARGFGSEFTRVRTVAIYKELVIKSDHKCVLV